MGWPWAIRRFAQRRVESGCASFRRYPLLMSASYRSCSVNLTRWNKRLAIETAIVELGKDLPGLSRVLQLPGLSRLSGIGLLAEMGDIKWCAIAKQLTAYAGLVTSVHQSGERERHGKITKQGRKRLRGIMIRAALTIARVPGAGPLRDFYLRKKREKGAGKALCAVARKLLTIVFVMLKKELDYWDVEDRLYNRKLQVLQAAA
jgi:transposase